jgi:hypothetical protein
VYTHARLSVYAHQRMLARIAQTQGKSEDYLRFLEDLEIIDGELRYSERQEEKSGRREIATAIAPVATTDVTLATIAVRTCSTR